MMSMKEIPRFGVCDFIAATESLFEGCLNMVGHKNVKEGKYYLDKSRALTDYVKKSKNEECPLFTSNNTSYYLNRCRYFIYQEKRTTTTDKNGNEITTAAISAEVFSQKTVRLFFELFEVNFCFLRLHPIDNQTQQQDIKFRRTQEECLENLFTVTVKYLCQRQSFDNNKESYGIPIYELKKLWKLLYRKYRFQLYADASDEKISFPQEIFTKEELLHHVLRLTQAIKFSTLFETLAEDENGPNSILIDINEKTMHLKGGYKDEINRMNKLVQNIQIILKAKEVHEIEEVKKSFPQEELQEYEKIIGDVSDEVDWKYFWIERIIRAFYFNRKYSFFVTVLYLQNFGTAKREYLQCCKKMWETVSSILKSDYRVVDCLLKGENIEELICELDETLWVLCYHNGDMNNE